MKVLLPLLAIKRHCKILSNFYSSNSSTSSFKFSFPSTIFCSYEFNIWHHHIQKLIQKLLKGREPVSSSANFICYRQRYFACVLYSPNSFFIVVETLFRESSVCLKNFKCKGALHLQLFWHLTRIFFLSPHTQSHALYLFVFDTSSVP